MLTDIYMKFRKDSWNGFQVIERNRFCDRQTEKKTDARGEPVYVNLPPPLVGGHKIGKCKDKVVEFSLNFKSGKTEISVWPLSEVL